MIKRKVSLICALALFAIIGCIYTTNAPDSENVAETVDVVDSTSAPSKESEATAPPAETTDEPVAASSTAAQTRTEQADVALNFGIATADEKYISKNSSNKGWGFKKEKGSAPTIDEKTRRLFAENSTYYIDDRDEKVIYLTFDEGYENGYTPKILDVLKEKSVPAAFFITGPYLRRETALVDRMVNEGHIVGNHTVNHPNLAKSDLSTVLRELKELNDEFFEKYGKQMIYMRPPEGEYSERLLCFAGDIGFKTVLWSFAYKDWDVKLQKGGGYAFEQVTPYLHKGAILLLHAVSSDNAEALGDIIDYAQNAGFEFKSLDYLFENK